MKKLPMDAAETLFDRAAAQNPGPWADHSRVVSRAAGVIAARCGMEAERAYALGLIHDIGRYKGVTDMMHILDGYRLMMRNGYEQAAQICITHSFPLQVFAEYSGKDDCTPGDGQTIQDILAASVYTDYDRLIQLCDSLALPGGVCLMEKRLVDVALRHGANDRMIAKWTKYLQIFQTFQEMAGTPLYSLFPEAAELTFHTGLRP